MNSTNGIMYATELSPISTSVVSATDAPRPSGVQSADCRGRSRLDDNDSFVFSWRELIKFSGPGLLMAIAYVDPGNLESDLQTGARTGYELGWLVVLSTALGFIVQLLAMRLGIVTHRTLADHCKDVYPPLPSYGVWIMMEIAIVGADIQEVIGSAIAIELLSGGYIPLWVGVLITAMDTFALLLLEQLGVRQLEAFFGILVATMTVSFGVMYWEADCPTGEVLAGTFIPRIKFTSQQMEIAAAMVGALVMPHNIFLHSAIVTSRLPHDASAGEKRAAIMYHGIEAAVSLTITVFINIFVMSVFAAGFYGRTDIDLDDIGLSTAGQYLGDHFSQFMKYVWAIGLFAAGQSSTMTGTYTGQFLMQGFVNLKVPPAMRVMVTRSVALVPTLLVALAFHKQMDQLNESLNVLQSMQLPFALIPVLYINAQVDIMKDRFVIRGLFHAVTLGICAMLLAVNGAVVMLQLDDWLKLGLSPGWTVLILTATFLYFVFVSYLLIGPRWIAAWLQGFRSPFAQWLADVLGKPAPRPGHEYERINGHGCIEDGSPGDMGGMLDARRMPLVSHTEQPWADLEVQPG